jgi:putative ABC transport system permease protein
LAFLGFLPGLVISQMSYQATSYLANIPIVMNGGRIASVLMMTIVMCALSGVGALRRVWRADPAALF